MSIKSAIKKREKNKLLEKSELEEKKKKNTNNSNDYQNLAKFLIGKNPKKRKQRKDEIIPIEKNKKRKLRKEEAIFTEFEYSKPLTGDQWLCCIRHGILHYYLLVQSDVVPSRIILKEHFDKKPQMWKILNELFI